MIASGKLTFGERVVVHRVKRASGREEEALAFAERGLEEVDYEGFWGPNFGWSRDHIWTT